jgi:hypothetical protein
MVHKARRDGISKTKGHMTQIYFDESGQTGTHLFDPQQPYFVLASTDLSDAESTEILTRAFPRQQAAELKAQSVLRRPNGQRGFLEFAREVGKLPRRFCAAKIGKRYAIISKMVDSLVEPLLSARGYDFYANNYAFTFANSVGFVFEHILPPPVAETLMALYNTFARNPDAAGLHKLQAALNETLRTAPDGSEVFLELLHQGALDFERRGNLATFEDTNDLHVTAAVTCVGYWQAQGPGPFEVVHDESLHFFARSARWNAFTDPGLDPMTFEIGDKTLILPMPVASTQSAHSHEHASLQVCDLIAGFISRTSAAEQTDEFREFAREAAAAGLGEVGIFPVDFGNEFCEGPPEPASGPDIVDQIALAVARGRGR